MDREREGERDKERESADRVPAAVPDRKTKRQRE
jgi:hypothetical protein